MPQLKVVPLGGMGNVTQNMYLYEYGDEILIIDCGIGFPDHYMPGVDILIPDISYLLKRLEEGARIVGMILSHGHDDHIAATAYLLPNLPDNFEIYGSPLTAAFAMQRMGDAKVDRKVNVVNDGKLVQVSPSFSFELINVTHSVPDTKHIVLSTPEGIIYHGTDFKLDPNPIDDKPTNMDAVKKLRDQNVLCMMIDCLRVEYDTWVKSESTTGPAIEQTMAETRGKYVLTLMSSHIHRIQQAVNAAEKFHRKVAFIGRSVEQNVRNAVELNMLHISGGMQIDKRDIDNYDDDKLCLIVAGSQGQEGSSLVRAIFGEHQILRIKPNDKVVFSANAIPGSELNYYGAIDELSRNGIHVVYPDIMPDLHQSGHGSAPEQLEMVKAVGSRFVMPIGGQDRHRVQFITAVAEPLGYSKEAVLIPAHGEVLGFENGQVKVVDRLNLRPQIVDGLGVGDVGPVVLSDRRALGQAGMVVVVMPRLNGRLQLENLQVISKGFVFMKEAQDVVKYIKDETANVASDPQSPKDDTGLTKLIEKRLARKLYKAIHREPMIVPVILDL